MIGIYKITNKLTNKVYIGQSVHIEHRWKEHISRANSGSTKLYKAFQLYGLENFSFEVLEECTAKDLDEKEKYWITQYDSFKNGYNSTMGGQKQTIDNSESIYKLWDKGYCLSDIVKETGLGHTTIQNYLKSYSNYSVKESNRRGGLKAFEKTMINNQSEKDFKIYQYDKNGVFVNEWHSTKEIERELNISACSVGKVLRGLRQSAGGFFWSNIKQDKINFTKKIKVQKEVEQLDLQGKYIKSFPSYAAAARAFGKQDGSAIRKVCNGKMPTAYGYKWRCRED